MTFQVLSPDAARRVDPPVSRFLQTLPQGRDIAVVPITRLDGFQFRDELRGTIEGKPWVLLDFSEFGPEWDQQTSHLWGRDRLAHGWFGGDEWTKLDTFIREHPPLITFQRELLLKDVSDTMQPVEYLNYSAPIQAETEDQFNARPIDVFFQWGFPIRSARICMARFSSTRSDSATTCAASLITSTVASPARTGRASGRRFTLRTTPA